MKCMSCQADIPPQWVSCINNNICPGCNGQIMDEKSKALLVELRENMAKMPNDPEGLAGWLLSNYQIIKLCDVVEPTTFHRKVEKAIVPTKKMVQASAEEDDVEEESDELKEGKSLLDKKRQNQFYKNAGVNTKRLSQMVDKIKSGDGGGGVITPEMFAAAGEEDPSDMGMGRDALDDSGPENRVMNILQSAGKGGAPTQADLRALQRLELNAAKRSQLVDEISTGGSVGLIRRS